MSLSQERPTNPSTRRMEIKNGTITFYDREEQKNVEVPTPFEFIVLDQLATVRGWSDADGSGYWSNEVKSVGKDTLTVRTSKGIKARGIWKDIKNEESVSGSKYHTSVYLAHKSGDGLVISNLLLKGATLNEWIEFTRKVRLNNVKVSITDWKEGKKGAVTYKLPVFEATQMSDSEKEEAVALDKELQGYFKEYFDYTPDEQPDTSLVDSDDISDEEIDLSKIPF